MEASDIRVSAVAARLDSLLRVEKQTGAPAEFAEVLSSALRSVDHAQVQSESLVRRFQSGDEGVGLEQAMIAMQKANVSLQAMVQVRNRLISAYHDVMNMQV